MAAAADPAPWPNRLGLAGLYTLALSYQLNATAAYIGLALAVLAFAFQAKHWLPTLKGDAAARLALALALWIALYAAWAGREFQGTGPEQQSAALAWLHGLLFPALAWQIRLARPGRLLLALAAGLLLRILLHADWARLGDIAHWPRTGFGLMETVFAPLAGMTALGWLLLAPRLARALPGFHAGAALALAGLAPLLAGVLLSQTRGVWLAAALAFPPAVLACHGAWLKAQLRSPAKALALLAVLALLAAGLARLDAGALLHRLRVDPAAARQLDRRDQASEAARSVGHRLEMWRLGLDKWAERPLTGWGPGTTEWLMRQAGSAAVEADNGRPYYHLHSHYVEILLRFGLLGAGLFGALAAVLAAGAWRAFRRQRIPRDYACFLLAGWGFAAVAAAFDFQLFKYAWRNACLIWLALNHAASLARDPDQP